MHPKNAAKCPQQRISGKIGRGNCLCFSLPVSEEYFSGCFTRLVFIVAQFCRQKIYFHFSIVKKRLIIQLKRKSVNLYDSFFLFKIIILQESLFKIIYRRF